MTIYKLKPINSGDHIFFPLTFYTRDEAEAVIAKAPEGTYELVVEEK